MVDSPSMKKLNKSLLILSLSLLSISGFAKTKQSELVEYLQNTYADQGQSYPILIIDQDEIDLRYALNDAYGSDDAKEKKRVEIFREYILEKSGVDLDTRDVVGLESYTTVMKDGAYAVPQFESYSNKSYEICLVFPASVNSNQRLETHRILGLDTPEAYPEDTYYRLKEKIPFDVLKKYSILHELGHCLDRTFMPKAYSSYEPSAHDVHLSESFAETFATFMLIKEGVGNFAQTRALFRNLYTRKMGQWFVDNPHNGFGNPLYVKGGVIYYLSPVLLQANYVVKRNRNLKDMSVMEYVEMAEAVVKENALHFRSFQGIYRTFGEDTNYVIDFYRDFAYDSPDLFKVAYEELLSFLDFSPYMEKELLGDDYMADTQDSGPFMEMDLAQVSVELQEYLKNPTLDSRENLFQWVELYRENLEQASALEYQEQVDRKKIMDNFWEIIQESSI